jgi:hypothetical protein
MRKYKKQTKKLQYYKCILNVTIVKRFMNSFIRIVDKVY